MYRKLMQANDWAREILPNAFMSLQGATRSAGSDEAISRNLMGIASRRLALTEWILHGNLGDHFESWEMTRKIARFSKEPGFGEETIFTAEVCQGNFHHHRKWTREVFEERLSVITRSSALSGVSDSERRRSVDDEAIPSFKEIASLPSVARNDKARL